MTVQEKFLSAYREYESLLRAAGMDAREAEDSLLEPDCGRMRLCRQIRNYLSHTDNAGFAGISDDMMRFLQGKAKELKEAGDVAKKHLKKPSACMLQEGMSCREAKGMFQKLKRQSLLILLPGCFARVSVYDLLLMDDEEDVKSVKRTRVKPAFCSPLDEYGKLPRCEMLCTDNGEKNGKLLGQVWFSSMP